MNIFGDKLMARILGCPMSIMMNYEEGMGQGCRKDEGDSLCLPIFPCLFKSKQHLAHVDS